MADNVNPSSSGSGWDDWDNWDSDTSTQSETVSATEGQSGVDSTPSGADEWGNFDNNAQSSNSNDWNLDESESTGNGQFIQPESDDWVLEEETPPTSQVNRVNRKTGNEQNSFNQSQQFDDSSIQNLSPVQEVATPRQFNLGKKTIGFILAGALIVLALIFLFFDGIKINKKLKVQQSVQQGQVQQESTKQPQSGQDNQSGNQNTNIVSGSVTLIEIPNTTALNYSGDIFETSGTVLSKTKYVQAHQVLYCITIRVAVGSSVEDINYYCNYASYNAVKVGDLLIVKYQQVDDNYISVNEILK